MRLTRAALFAVLVWAALAAVPAASAAQTPAPTVDRSVVEVGRDAVVVPNTVTDSVYVVGGDALVAGYVLHDVVVIGGDVVLLPTATVRENVVCLGGHLRRDPGAIVDGDTVVIHTPTAGSIAHWTFVRRAVDLRSGDAILGWLVSSVVYVLLAMALAALAPRQIDAAAGRLRAQPWACLGWGLVSLLAVVPIVSIVLFVTVIGVALAVPWLLVVVPVALLLGFAAASMTLGALVLRRRPATTAARVSCAAAGAGLLALARLAPYAGVAAWAVASVLGLGAVSVSVWIWWRRRRTARTPSPADATTTPPSPSP